MSAHERECIRSAISRIRSNKLARASGRSGSSLDRRPPHKAVVLKKSGVNKVIVHVSRCVCAY